MTLSLSFLEQFSQSNLIRRSVLVSQFIDGCVNQGDLRQRGLTRRAGQRTIVKRRFAATLARRFR